MLVGNAVIFTIMTETEGNSSEQVIHQTRSKIDRRLTEIL
jgi:hypothetical protein